MTTPDAQYDKNNLFAKIMQGEIPCHKIYEDAETFAFMDINPRSTGHCLVIPKAPSRNILDANDEALAAVIQTAKKIAQACKKAFNADGISLQQFNETAAGQSVFHLHVHVVPCFEGVKLLPHMGKTEAPEVLAENAKKIVTALS